MNISFVIPMFNAEKFISDSVHSVFNGNFFNGDELIIVNDGSSDNSLSISQQLQTKIDKDIKIIDLKTNKGGSTARNEGVSLSRNPFIFNLDADNILLPNSINKLKFFFKENSLDAASFRNLYYFKKDISKISHIWNFNPGIIKFEDCLSGSVNPIASGNYLFKKSIWEAIGGYEPNASALDAWFFGFEIIANGFKFGVMNNGGYFHRHGHDSYWMRSKNQNLISRTAANLVLKYKDMISENGINFLENEVKSQNWFENLQKNPLKTKQNETGLNGNIIFNRLWKKIDLKHYEN